MKNLLKLFVIKKQFGSLLICQVSKLLLFTLISPFLLIGQSGGSGIFNCASPEPSEIMSPGDCTPGSQKCVRVLFHFLNNTINPTNSPSDEFFKKFLDELNKYFEPGNIHLTFGPKCIFTGSVSTDLDDDSKFAPYFFDGNNNFAPKPEMGWDDEYLNIYFFQKAIFNGGVARGNWSCNSILDTRVLSHEIGHMLGLTHTFGPTNGGYLLPQSLWECKDRNEIGTHGCAIAGDKLCDTGADPFAMDLDNNSAPDQYQWVSNCMQNISNSILDACGTNIAWNIPVKNIMSQYLSCISEFSPCQFKVMHDNLENPAKSQKFLLNCADDPALAICPDITISTPTVWTNQTINMCPKQKIIITNTGSLTLVNTKITKKIDNTSCPGLSGNWASTAVRWLY